MPEKPPRAAVALAGPAVSLILAAIPFAHPATGGRRRPASSTRRPGRGAVLINLSLAVFNLLPASDGCGGPARTGHRIDRVRPPRSRATWQGAGVRRARPVQPFLLLIALFTRSAPREGRRRRLLASLSGISPRRQCARAGASPDPCRACRRTARRSPTSVVDEAAWSE
jgi:hypothetical protein